MQNNIIGEKDKASEAFLELDIYWPKSRRDSQEQRRLLDVVQYLNPEEDEEEPVEEAIDLAVKDQKAAGGQDKESICQENFQMQK